MSREFTISDSPDDVMYRLRELADNCMAIAGELEDAYPPNAAARETAEIWDTIADILENAADQISYEL